MNGSCRVDSIQWPPSPSHVSPPHRDRLHYPRALPTFTITCLSTACSRRPRVPFSAANTLRFHTVYVPLSPLPLKKPRSRMHLYTKRYIDTLFRKALFNTPEVHLISWSKEQIDNYRLDKNDKRGVVYLPQKGDDDDNGPAKKKQKLSDENDKTVLKLVLSRDGESDTFKSTIINSKEEGNKNAKKSDTKKNYKNNEKTNEISNKKTNEISNEKTNENSNEKNNVISNTNETTDDNTDFSNEPVKVIASDPSKVGKITVRDMSKLVAPRLFQNFCDAFIPKTAKNDEIKSTNIISVSPASRPIKTTKQLKLSEIESLYQKYFSKSIQDNIVIIANILNIISMSNKHHKARMDESFKKKSEAEKLKERCDANRVHLRHKKILESKLKKYFLEVLGKFAIPEFEPAFQMFFLSILTVLRVLDQPKFKKGSIFKNLVLLLWNSLKNSELEHAKVFSMFRSKTFRPDCIDLISLIEDSRDSDPGITDRMSLFFVSSVNSQEYFQSVINTVTSDSNEDLALLIDQAALQCSINSKFKSSVDLPSSSAVKKVINVKAPASATQTTLKNDESIQRWVLAKTPNGTFQPISVTDTSKTKSPTAPENGKPSQQLNTFYESFSNSIARVSTSNGVSKILVPKGIVTSSPNVPNGSLQTGPTFVTFKPTLQGIKSTTITRPEGSTIFLGNKQYTVIRSPANPIRGVPVNQNNILMTPVRMSTDVQMSTGRTPADIPIKCFAKNCRSAATIMCSTCRSVKYCTHNCQRLDWYETHIHNCERLNDIRMRRLAKATNDTNK